jgi:predicted nucleic acid-binding protein
LTRLSNLADTAIVPALWLYEVVNVTEIAVRRRRLTKEKASAFLNIPADLPINFENPTRERLFVSVRALADRHKLTAYDASYLELAMRLTVPIASSDKALAEAAHAAGIGLVRL